MPICACFHEFELTPDGAGRFLLVLDAEGYVPLLADILGPSGLAAQSRFGLGASYNLTGIQDEQQVNDSLSPFRRRIVIGLDQVDQCYALGPYSVRAGDGVWDHPEFGEAVRRAKYAKDQSARVMLSHELANFAKSHPGMRSVAAVAAPPKFDPEELNLPLT